MRLHTIFLRHTSPYNPQLSLQPPFAKPQPQVQTGAKVAGETNVVDVKLGLFCELSRLALHSSAEVLLMRVKAPFGLSPTAVLCRHAANPRFKAPAAQKSPNFPAPAGELSTASCSRWKTEGAR